MAPEFTIQIAMVLGIALAVVLLFITERIRVDVVAIMVMVALPLLGLIDGRETFQGLSSTAVVSIIAVIIMSRGLDHTGVIRRGVRPLLLLAGSSRRRTILMLSGIVAVISSFMQNIGAAALFLPAIQRISRHTGISVSDLLIPVGFSAILGGTISLVGSSPLIMLNDLLRPFGLEPFNLFSVTPAGVALVATGIVYFILAGRFVLPRRTEAPAGKPHLNAEPLDYYPEIVKLFELENPWKREGPALKVQQLCDRYNIHVVALSLDRGRHKILPPDREMSIPPGSVFAVYGTREHVEQTARDLGFKIKPDLNVFSEDLSTDISGVAEAIVSPHSDFLGKTFAEIRFRHNHLMAPLAVMHQGRIQYTSIGERLIEPGDVILMHGRWETFQRMRSTRNLLFAQPLDQEILHTHKAAAALACFALATALVIFTSLPLSVCLMTGALGMILTGALTIDQAYQGVDWRTVFLLSGLIPLGIAMQKTGAASWLAYYMLDLVGEPSPAFFIFTIALITTVLTLVISNVGAAVLLVPLVVDMAMAINVDPRLAALVVGLAASNSFLLPTHQVNALYMGPGGYTNRDFIKAGAPLSLLFLLVLTGAMLVFY
jgi:di/tricarboxylate transporter